MKLSTEQIELADKLIQSGVAKGIVCQMMGVSSRTMRQYLNTLHKGLKSSTSD